MLEIVTTGLEILGFVLIIAGVGVVTAFIFGGLLGAGLGLVAAGLSSLGLSALTQSLASRDPKPEGRRQR